LRTQSKAHFFLFYFQLVENVILPDPEEVRNVPTQAIECA